MHSAPGHTAGYHGDPHRLDTRPHPHHCCQGPKLCAFDGHWFPGSNQLQTSKLSPSQSTDPASLPCGWNIENRKLCSFLILRLMPSKYLLRCSLQTLTKHSSSPQNLSSSLCPFHLLKWPTSSSRPLHQIPSSMTSSGPRKLSAPSLSLAPHLASLSHCDLLVECLCSWDTASFLNSAG